MAKVLVTGANRGIGLGLTEELLKRGDHVIACSRSISNAGELQALSGKFPSGLQLVKLDLRNLDDIRQIKHSSLEWGPIDWLISNAGVYPEGSEHIDELDPEKLRLAFEVNVIGSLSILQALRPALQKSKAPKIFQMSSMMGSIADNTSGGSYAYRISKTALNMFNRCLSLEWPEAICIVLHPGWVKTRMGGPEAPMSVENSVKGLIRVMDGAQISDTGKFLNFQGKELPW